MLYPKTLNELYSPDIRPEVWGLFLKIDKEPLKWHITFDKGFWIAPKNADFPRITGFFNKKSLIELSDGVDIFLSAREQSIAGFIHAELNRLLDQEIPHAPNELLLMLENFNKT